MCAVKVGKVEEKKEVCVGVQSNISKKVMWWSAVAREKEKRWRGKVREDGCERSCGKEPRNRVQKCVRKSLTCNQKKSVRWIKSNDGRIRTRQQLTGANKAHLGSLKFRGNRERRRHCWSAYVWALSLSSDVVFL